MADPQAANGEVLAWEDDPGQPDAPNTPISRPRPETNRAPFPTEISGEAPAPDAEGTPGFRYWAAAEALRRTSDFWGGICGEEAPWNPNVGDVMPIELDAGKDLNAYYDREGLKFFHDEVGGHPIYSASSTEVVSHEAGHALLDAVAPQLWGVHSAEPPALHESFGDMSGMLCTLQLPSFRAEVIASTSGSLDRTSRLSRMAEQLGWAIRQRSPQGVEADCLRNAANAFFYRDPLTLPPRAPATSLSSEPHSFSRVFTGAFLSALAGMFKQGSQDDAGLVQVTEHAGRLLIDAARTTPVCVGYFSQFAAHMLSADETTFGGQYAKPLREGFVRHGVLALNDATASLPPTAPPPVASMTAAAAAAPTPSVERVALSGQAFGLDEPLHVQAPAAPKRFAVTSAALDVGSISEPSAEAAAAGYVEDVFRRGHVAIPEESETSRAVAVQPARATHEVRREDDNLVLVRLLFKCGWGCDGE